MKMRKVLCTIKCATNNHGRIISIVLELKAAWLVYSSSQSEHICMHNFPFIQFYLG